MDDIKRNAPGGALARFRADVFANAELQDKLQSFDDPELFITAALSEASARGLSIEPDELRRSLKTSPLLISGLSDAPLTASRPLQNWLPIQIVEGPDGPSVEWAHFGPDGPAEPFFQDSVRTALRRPINRFAKHRTALNALFDVARDGPTLRPSGLIFHMSRCGSTLVAQMLAQDRRNVVISEAPPVDSIVRAAPNLANSDQLAALLTVLVGALGRRRAPWQERCFLKLDSWHALYLPLFRKAFPDVPWVFLFREPAEVLASQVVQRGIQTVEEYMPASLFGLDGNEARSPEDYCALVLRQICRAALTHYPLGGGLLINYRLLPQALWTQILPHFGVACSDEDRARMAETARFNAKSPGLTFLGDDSSKKDALTRELAEIANRRLGSVYAELDRNASRASTA